MTKKMVQFLRSSEHASASSWVIFIPKKQLHAQPIYISLQNKKTFYRRIMHRELQRIFEIEKWVNFYLGEKAPAIMCCNTRIIFLGKDNKAL